MAARFKLVKYYNLPRICGTVNAGWFTWGIPEMTFHRISPSEYMEYMEYNGYLVGG
jgi:hypothetical protein